MYQQPKRSIFVFFVSAGVLFDGVFFPVSIPISNSEINCHLKKKLCTNTYFHDMPCLKINQNLEKVPLNIESLHQYKQSSGGIL